MKQSQTVNFPHKNSKLFLIKSSNYNKNNKNDINNKINNNNNIKNNNNNNNNMHREIMAFLQHV